jgi:hypothetical protein
MHGRVRTVKITMTAVAIQSTNRRPLPPVRLCTTALTATLMNPNKGIHRTRRALGGMPTCYTFAVPLCKAPYQFGRDTTWHLAQPGDL